MGETVEWILDENERSMYKFERERGERIKGKELF